LASVAGTAIVRVPDYGCDRRLAPLAGFAAASDSAASGVGLAAMRRQLRLAVFFRARFWLREAAMFQVLSELAVAFAAGLLAQSPPARAVPTAQTGAPTAAAASVTTEKPRLDRSGKKQKGKASYYSRKFNGRKMADGTPLDPSSNAAASKTLPLGTKARVTNLQTGKSAVVEIKDRGPYVAGRSIDLTPKTARDIGITRAEGVAPVEVAPLEVPQRDGSVREIPAGR
jgi:rare lipoprotein A